MTLLALAVFRFVAEDVVIAGCTDISGTLAEVIM